MADKNQNPTTMEEAYDQEAAKRKSWAGFVEGEVVNFFDLHELDKMTIEDGEGNKAKLARIKDNSIKIEYTSHVIL